MAAQVVFALTEGSGVSAVPFLSTRFQREDTKPAPSSKIPGAPGVHAAWSAEAFI